MRAVPDRYIPLEWLDDEITEAVALQGCREEEEEEEGLRGARGGKSSTDLPLKGEPDLDRNVAFDTESPIMKEGLFN